MPFSLLPFPLPPPCQACTVASVAEKESPRLADSSIRSPWRSTSPAMGISLTISSINCHFPPIYLFCDIFLCLSLPLSPSLLLFRCLCGCFLLLLLLLLPVYTFPGCAAATATMASNVLQQIRSLIYAKTCFDPTPLSSPFPLSRQPDGQINR